MAGHTCLEPKMRQIIKSYNDRAMFQNAELYKYRPFYIKIPVYNFLS
jgi:hypothetical protein